MKAVKEIRKLLFLGLAAAVFLTIAPIQSTKAGYYYQHQYWDGDHYGTEPYYGEVVWVYSDGAAWANANQTYCDVYSYADVYLGDGEAFATHTGFAHSSDVWIWVGEGTPTGGALSYNWSAYGVAQVYGRAFDYFHPASASSHAYSNGTGNPGVGRFGGRGYAHGSGSGDGYGATAEVDGYVDPPDGGWFDGHTSGGLYDAWDRPEGAIWSFDHGGSEIISEGTKYVYFSVRSYCTCDSSASAIWEADAWAQSGSSSMINVNDATLYPW